MKKALVVDWLDKYGGAERVLTSLQNVFQFNEMHALVDIMKKNDFKKIFPDKYPITTTLLQKFGRYFRAFFFTFHYFTSKIKVDKDIDLIISSSHAVAKGVKKSSDHQLHISYFQARNFKYIWDEVDLYFGKTAFLLKPLIIILRKIDVRQAQRPDYIISNSKFVQNWVKQTYNRDSVVIYPPVSLEHFTFCDAKEDYYVAIGRIVPYKRFDLVVETFNQLNKKLIIIGDGDQLSNLKKIAKENIQFTGYLDSTEVNKILSKAKAFIHIGLEDFGIAPIEAQACGTPVIAYKAGGVLETVVNGKTGILFNEQTPASLINAINEFEQTAFNLSEIRNHAFTFSKERFESEMKAYVSNLLPI